MHREEEQRPVEERDDERGDEQRRVERDEVHEGPVQTVEDSPAVTNGPDDGREVVVEQHHGRGFARHRRAAVAHRDPDVGLSERGCVVDAVTRHRDDFSLPAERANEPVLLLGSCAGEHVRARNDDVELLVRGGIDLVARHDEIRSVSAGVR